MSERADVVSNAPDVGFTDVHRARVKELKKGPDLPPSGGSDGVDSVFIKCKQCGFPIDKTKHAEGSGYGNLSSTTVRPSSTTLIAATIGGTTTYAGGYVTTVADYMYGRYISLTTAGQVRWIVAYLAATSSVTVGGALFRSDGTLIGYTEERSVYTAGYYTFRVLTPVNLSKGDVIIAAFGSASSFRLYYQTASGTGVYAEQDYTYFPPARVVWGASNYDYSVFIAYTKGDSFQTEVGAGCPHCGSSEYA